MPRTDLEFFVLIEHNLFTEIIYENIMQIEKCKPNKVMFLDTLGIFYNVTASKVSAIIYWKKYLKWYIQMQFFYYMLADLPTSFLDYKEFNNCSERFMKTISSNNQKYIPKKRDGELTFNLKENSKRANNFL